ncbi:MAG: lysophospholipid acyltransferase family protein [Rhodospirillaceae bacterium]|nr:lysophospholipid acyltransferase family protein [Rhodospirillaceae bacterium]
MRLGKLLLGASPVQAAFGFLAAQYVRLVWLTTKWQRVNDRVIPDLLGQGQPTIFATWHGRLMMVPIAWPGSMPVHLLVSRHDDGELIARAMGHFNMVMVRGSTHRPDRERDKGGSAALRGMLAVLKQGHAVGITPDGPRGPAMHLSAGVITLARLSGAAIVPLAVGTGRHHVLDTWDGFRFALPFSKGAMVFGEPITIERRIDGPAREAARRQVEAALMAVSEQADRLTGAAP